MIKIIFEFAQFLLTNLSLITSTLFFALMSVWLADTIKRRSRLCYWIAALPAILVCVPLVLRWCGVDFPVNFTGVPVLGQLLRDYIHMGTLGHPLLVIIMYVGALDSRTGWVRRLMSIRGELSILVGFPVLTHTLVRVASVAGSWRFFVDNEGYLAENPVVSVTGAGFTNFSFLLGVVLIALFVPLWVTSFPSVRRRMGAVRWKRLQRWAYVMYAAMFVHAAAIQVGGMLNPRSGGGGSSRPVAEQAAQAPADVSTARGAARGDSEASRDAAHDGGASSRGARSAYATEQTAQAPATEQRAQATATAQTTSAAQPARTGRVMPKGFSDFKVSAKTRQWIHLCELALVYGSYVCLRLRKRRGSTRGQLLR